MGEGSDEDHIIDNLIILDYSNSWGIGNERMQTGGLRSELEKRLNSEIDVLLTSDNSRLNIAYHAPLVILIDYGLESDWSGSFVDLQHKIQDVKSRVLETYTVDDLKPYLVLSLPSEDFVSARQGSNPPSLDDVSKMVDKVIFGGLEYWDRLVGSMFECTQEMLENRYPKAEESRFVTHAGQMYFPTGRDGTYLLDIKQRVESYVTCLGRDKYHVLARDRDQNIVALCGWGELLADKPDLHQNNFPPQGRCESCEMTHRLLDPDYFPEKVTVFEAYSMSRAGKLGREFTMDQWNRGRAVVAANYLSEHPDDPWYVDKDEYRYASKFFPRLDYMEPIPKFL